ncbi:MAG: hypothetical protein U0414_26090 [Polyangiaceae bacterium]
MKAVPGSVKMMFVAALLASGAAACKSDDGSGGAGGATSASTGTKMATSSSTKATTGTAMTSGTGGGPVCGLTFDDRPDCETCMEDSCCSELQECDPNSNSDCGKLVVCLNACMSGDSACQDACIAADTSGAGLTALQAIFSCYDGNCKTTQACEYPICDSMLLFADEACAGCLGNSCCQAIKDCVADTGCQACLTMNPPLDPGAPCGTAGSPSDMLYQAQDTCEHTTCKADCTFTICGSTLGYNASSCNSCLSDHCCTAYDPCLADTACKACLTNPDGAGCTTNQLFTAFTTCRDTAGANTCGDAGECN